jgi:transposase InsO family protein
MSGDLCRRSRSAAVATLPLSWTTTLKFSVVVPVATKADVPDVVKRTMKLLETQAGRTDNGGEYLNKNLQEYFASKGVVHQTITPYTPEQNVAADRLNRTLEERMRAMLIGADLTSLKTAGAKPATALSGRIH